MAEYRIPTQQEIDKLLYMQGLQGKSNQQIIDENLARGTTIQSLPDNFFQTVSAGTRRVGDFVNQAGNAQQIVNKLFPSNIGNSQYQVSIPTGFNFAPKQAPTGEILPAGLQTQSVPVASILQAIKPADVLGISGAERAYGDIGAGKAPQPMDVVDTLGVGAGLTAASRLAAKGGMAAGRYIAPELGNMAEQYAAKTGLLQSVKPIDATGTGLLQTAPMSNIGFYSAVEQAAMASPRKSATGQAFLNDIMKGQDVRADEIKWMGLDDYLKDKKSITKQEVQDYIANNRVNVQEVRLGESVAEDPVGIAKRKAVFDKYEPEIQALYKQIDSLGYGTPHNVSYELDNKLRKLQNMRDLEADAAYVVPEPIPTRFSKYQLAGGENYRELVLTMPAKQLTEAEARIVLGAAPDAKLSAGDMAYASRKNANEYKSSHFPEQENPLAHIRVNDRIDADGKKMLLIEEIQSDWHQAGRDKGYVGQVKSAKDLENELTEINRERSKLLQYAADLPDSKMAEFKQVNTKIKELEEKARNVDTQIYQAVDRGDPVPDAPFKDTWYQLALKRAIQHAAENGYDRIGLTTGKQQITRYENELRQVVDEISFQTGAKLTQSEADELYSLRQNMKNLTGLQKQRYEQLYSKEGEYVGENETKVRGYKGSKPTFEGTVKNGKFIDGAAEGKTVEEVLGKSMAKQIAEKKTGKIEGDDLTIGGEGMKQYYDKSYPEFLNKYSKKWGAKVGETNISTDRGNIGGMPSMYPNKATVRYIDITPEMKAGVSKGQPLFAAVPAIPAAGLLAPQKEQRR
jgi:ElaB/YqjD/DUF883 family membrane-anchored ribosome-binding protein